jgi:hypothetical protein
MPLSPLTILFPIGVLAAIVAAALGEHDAEASISTPEGAKQRLTREEWEASKQGWFDSFGPNLNCQPGYRIKWNDYDGSMATFVCEALPVVTPVAPTAPGQAPVAPTPTIDNRPPTLPPPSLPNGAQHPAQVAPEGNRPLQAPSARVPSATVQTPSGPVQVARVVTMKEYEADKKRKQKQNNCAPGSSPKFLPYNQSWAEYVCEPSAASVLAAKQDEHKEEKQRVSTIREISREEAARLERQSINVAPAKEKKRKVSLAEWQADQKRKLADNNCEDGFAPKFAAYNGDWAEYACAPTGVAKILTDKQKPAKVEAPREQASTIKEVQKTAFEPGAAPYVSDALKSKDAQKITDVADSIDSQYPNAANYLRAEAPKYAMTFEPDAVTLKDKKKPSKKPAPMSFTPDVVTLKSKEPEHKPSAVSEILKAKESAKEVSKKEWEADKARKQASNNCGEGYKPEFKPYAKSNAEYDCKLDKKIAEGKAILAADGIEKDMAEKIAIFLSGNPSPTDARSMAAYYKTKKPATYAALNRYANVTELANQHLAKQESKGKPTEPKAVVQAANATKNPAELLAHAKTLDITGNPKAAEKVRARANDEAAKQGVTIVSNEEAAKLVKAKKQSDLDALKQAGFVERKEVTTPSGDKKAVPVVVKVSDAQAKEDKKQAEKKVEAKEAAKESAKKEAKLSAKEKADQDAKAEKVKKAEAKQAEENKKYLDELRKTTQSSDPLAGLKLDKVSGDEDSYNDSLPSESAPDSARASVSSPIDGVDDRGWVAFVSAMKTGKPQTITPSYALGMFGFGARRLADYGLMDNPRQTEYHGNTVWSGEWAEPWDLETFLSDAGAQYVLFENDLAAKAQYILETEAEGKQIIGKLIEGRPATLSGLLAVAFKTTEKSFNHWLDASHEERMKFPATMQLFEKANGIF